MSRGRLAAAALLAGVVVSVVSALGIGVAATDGARAAVDEPQYLLTATSLWEDGDLDVSDELAAGRASGYHASTLPTQTEVAADGRQVSPHDPLLPLLLAPATGLGGWVAAKTMLALLAGGVAALTTWLAGTRLGVGPATAAVVAGVAGLSAPLVVYGQQVYPELPAALVVLAAVAVLLPARAGAAVPGPAARWSAARSLGLVVAVSALPWLAVKYVPVAAALAAVGVVSAWRGGQRRSAGVVVGALAASGAVWLAAHRALYGGWTAYAGGDHFQASGDIGAVGFAPDLLGRSTRLVGLLADRDFGLLAWAPAWLLAVPALGALLAGASRRPLVASALGAPLVAGWLTATFVALTMHGYWWPGRQVVVVLPLAALVVAAWLARLSPAVRRVAAAVGASLAAAGLLVVAWVLAAGLRGDLTWVGAPDAAAPWPLAALRLALPDYREPGTPTWVLHAVWTAVLLALLVAGARTGRPATPVPATRRPATPLPTPAAATPTVTTESGSLVGGRGRPDQTALTR